MPRFEIVEVPIEDEQTSACSSRTPHGCELCGHCAMLRAFHRLRQKALDRSDTPADSTASTDAPILTRRLHDAFS